MARLKESPQRLLVDNSVLANRCFSFTGESGRRGFLLQEHSYTQSHMPHTGFWQDRKYLYGIRELAKAGRVRLFDSYELRAERLTHKLGQYYGKKSMWDEDVLDGVEIENVDGYPELEVWKKPPEYWRERQREFNRRGGGIALQSDQPIPRWFAPDLYEIYEATEDRIRNYGDPLHDALLSALHGRSYLKDAWHIVMAERHEFDCFLTMDYKLIDRVKQLRRKEPVRSLSTSILTPSEWGVLVGIAPIDRPDLVGELAGRRQPDPYYRLPDNFMSRNEVMNKVWQESAGNAADEDP